MTTATKPSISRRDALKGLFTLSAASAIGCGGSENGPDASMRPDASESPDAHAESTDASSPLDAHRPVWDAGPAPTGPFQHGVASGDPWPSSVILWTRISEATGEVGVEWEVATDPSFGTIVARGRAETNEERDFTVKVEAEGLSPATTYYYRFRTAGSMSPIGRTRTAPDGSTERLRFAVCSCSSYAHGYFHAYRRIAERADLDAVIHLGDYIYEYGTGMYGGFRPYDPPHEILTLEDYRRRYRQYRLDRDLQEAHRQHPFIPTWDDHETADNSYATGASNHNPGEGAWLDRLRAATRAYREWMPFRETLEGDRLRLFRALRYGDLAELIVLDTRIWGRDRPATGMSDPSFASETRQLLGADQEDWLLGRLRDSSARWKLVCQQVMMAQLPLVLNTDQWDGYPAQRQRLFSFLADNPSGERDGVVVLTGDIHSSWACDLTPTPTDRRTYSPTTGEGSLAVEFVCPGITSPGAGESLERLLRARLPTDGPHVKYVDLSRRGYIVLDLDRARAQAAWFHVTDVTSPTGGAESASAAWEVRVGTRHLVESAAPAMPRAGAPMLAPE